MPAKSRRPPAWLVVAQWAAVLALGAVLGSGLAVLGETMLPSGPLLTPIFRTWPLGVEPPARIDLEVFTLVVGGTARVGALTVVGAAGAGWLLARSARA